MARLEIRTLPQEDGTERWFLLVIPEHPRESELVDLAISPKIPSLVIGKVSLSDGYGPHHISLELVEEGRDIPGSTMMTEIREGVRDLFTRILSKTKPEI